MKEKNCKCRHNICKRNLKIPNHSFYKNLIHRSEAINTCLSVAKECENQSVNHRRADSVWTRHAFLDEELSPLQGSCKVLAESLALLFVEHLGVEGANLQLKETNRTWILDLASQMFNKWKYTGTSSWKQNETFCKAVSKHISERFLFFSTWVTLSSSELL